MHALYHVVAFCIEHLKIILYVIMYVFMPSMILIFRAFQKFKTYSMKPIFQFFLSMRVVSLERACALLLGPKTPLRLDASYVSESYVSNFF